MADGLTPDEIEGILKGFRELDKDGDGFVSRDEIKQYCLQTETVDEQTAEKELCEFMDIYDVNGDDQINFVKFLHFVSKHLYSIKNNM